MIIIAFTMLVILTLVAGLHLYWGLGGLWPANSEEQLIQTVVGSNSTSRMPPGWLTMMVAVLVFIAGVLPVMHVTGVTFGAPDFLIFLAIGVLTFVFLGRGLTTYLMPSLTENSAEPFRTLNRRYFSPLCLILGIGFGSLLILT